MKKIILVTILSLGMIACNSDDTGLTYNPNFDDVKSPAAKAAAFEKISGLYYVKHDSYDPSSEAWLDAGTDVNVEVGETLRATALISRMWTSDMELEFSFHNEEGGRAVFKDGDTIFSFSNATYSGAHNCANGIGTTMGGNTGGIYVRFTYEVAGTLYRATACKQ